ncbi:MAG: TolC family protein [Verrucomicrobia bacterium]|nr:TolC family protein [Verrucomicrobiota bacterium]MCF7709364.1 TolC family protein [Verrucomicrobiota bacterium]
MATSDAAGAQTNKVTLDDCIWAALENNLDVQIQRLAPEISEYNLSAAYGGYDPTLSFEGRENYRSSPQGIDRTTNLQLPPNETYNEVFSSGLSGLLPTGLQYSMTGDLYRSSGTSFTGGYQYQGGVSVNLTQPLLKNFWIDSTRMQIKVNKRNLKISELALKQQIMATVMNVELAYYDLIFARESVDVREMAFKLAERLYEDNQKRVDAGKMSPLDVKQAQSQMAVSRADLITAERTLSAQQNALKRLITQEFTEWQSVFLLPEEALSVLPTSFSRQDSWSKALALRPDYLQQKLETEKQGIIVSYNFNQLFPSLDLVGSYGRNGLERSFGGLVGRIEDEENPNFSFGGIIRIPLSNRAARNNYKASKAQKKQSLLRLKKLEQQILVEVDDAIQLAKANLQRVEATRAAREYAEAALEAEERKLESGKSTSYTVLQMQRDLTTARSQEIRAVADYNKALTQLSFYEGDILARHGIELDLE